MKCTLATMAIISCLLVDLPAAAERKKITTFEQVKAVAWLESLHWAYAAAAAEKTAMPIDEPRAIDLSNLPTPYRHPLSTLVKGLATATSLKLTPLDEEMPLGYAVPFQGKPSFVLAGFTTTTVYNTVRLTSKQRAADLFSKEVLPLIVVVAKSLRDTPAQFYGVAISFRSSNALEADLFPSPESLVVMVPRATAIAYAESEVTDADVAKRSAVFLQDRDAHDYARVSLNLD